MNRKIKDFLYLTASDLTMLQGEVRDYLKKGYEPAGNIVSCDEGFRGWAQAMAFYGDTEKENPVEPALEGSAGQEDQVDYGIEIIIHPQQIDKDSVGYDLLLSEVEDRIRQDTSNYRNITSDTYKMEKYTCVVHQGAGIVPFLAHRVASFAWWWEEALDRIVSSDENPMAERQEPLTKHSRPAAIRDRVLSRINWGLSNGYLKVGLSREG